MDKDLKALGLTDNEIKVYKSLLKLGETVVGGITNDLKIHRQIAYNSLELLERRGMVEKTMKNDTYHFQASDPDAIVEEVKKKELIAKRVSQAVKQELKKGRREHEIHVYSGQAGAQKFYVQSLKDFPPGKTVHIMGTGVSDYVKALGQDFVAGAYNRLKNARQARSKLIISEALRQENTEYEKLVDPKLRETRYLPYENKNPVSTSIWPDRVSFMSTSPEVFIIEIRNKEFRDSYMEHFDLLWKMAKK